MRTRSVALKTELGLAATKGVLLDRGDYVVVRTPDEPSYYFGNYLMLGAPPQVGEVTYNERRFTTEFRDHLDIRHVAFRWDSTQDDGALTELVAAGFTVENDWVMTATRVAAAPTAFAIRPLSAADVPAVVKLGFAIADDHSDSYRQFLNRRGVWKRDIIERRLGTWWGAFDGGALVGSLGLVPFDRVARYQDVQTAATHRKRGIAAALLAAAAAAVEVDAFVIVTEPDSAASRIYARAGFGVVERMVSAVSAPASR